MNCPVCQEPVGESAKFCPECGHRLGGSSAVLPGSVPPSGPGDSLGDAQTIGGRTGGATSSSVRFAPLDQRYDVLGPLGSGGFATVFKAHDRDLHREVAIKRLHTAGAGPGSAALERFLREARAIAQLKHRNIVQVFDQAQDKDGLYIVMELAEGGTLDDRIRQGALPVNEAVGILTGICRGLSYAHRRGLIHRDIKPRNILLVTEDGDWVPKITDFGLARFAFDGDVSVSMSGQAFGTPWYMPPEQWRDAKNVNHTADIYALGKTLYELLTGESPENVDPDLLNDYPQLSKILFRCIKTRPEDRYFSVDELLQALEAVPVAPLPKPQPATAKGSVDELIARNACPQCFATNPAEGSYCLGCGTSLVRNCPECDVKGSPHVRFCGQCGTDVEGFQTWSSTADTMEASARLRRWDRSVEAFATLPHPMKLPGSKGRQLLERVKALGDMALAQYAELDRLRTAAAHADSDKSRVGLLRQLRNIATHSAVLDGEIDRLDQAIARREEEQRQAEARALEERRRAEQQRREAEARQRAEAERLRLAEETLLREERERLHREVEQKLVVLVRESLDRTNGKPTADDSAAATRLIRESDFPRDVARAIVARVQTEWREEQRERLEQEARELAQAQAINLRRLAEDARVAEWVARHPGGWDGAALQEARETFEQDLGPLSERTLGEFFEELRRRYVAECRSDPLDPGRASSHGNNAVLLPLRGVWCSRRLDSDFDWQQEATLPDLVRIDPDRAYLLGAAPDTQDADLAALANLRRVAQLKALRLSWCELLTDRGLAHLEGLSQIESLDLKLGDRITDAGLAPLRSLTGLKQLDLLQCYTLTDAGLDVLRDLPRLESLTLSGMRQITDAGVRKVAGCSGLRTLGLWSCRHLTDAAMEPLQTLRELRSLTVHGCPELTLDGVRKLAVLPELRQLSLYRCLQVRSPDMHPLRKDFPNCRVTIVSPRDLGVTAWRRQHLRQLAERRRMRVPPSLPGTVEQLTREVSQRLAEAQVTEPARTKPAVPPKPEGKPTSQSQPQQPAEKDSSLWKRLFGQ